MVSGGKGYDPQVKEWFPVLLPLALDREVCIITNMGAIDPRGAQKEVLDLASNLGLEITVAVAYESSIPCPGMPIIIASCMESRLIIKLELFLGNYVLSDESIGSGQGTSTYLGAASIVHCLENYKPHVITSQVADAALFLAPMLQAILPSGTILDAYANGSNEE